MSRFQTRLVIITAALGLATIAATPTLFTAQARQITPAEKRHSPYTGAVPRCGDPAVLNRIQSRFSQRETTYWHTGKEILRFYRARQVGYRSNGADFIPKRYCTVRARFNDGRKRRVTYSIGEDLGMAGFGWGVEWCVHGLDYNRGFAPNCKMARP